MYLALVATARRAAAAPSAPVMTVADIKSCGRDANKALSMLEEMRKAHQTDIYAYATAISVCSKAGEWEKALSVLSSMDSDGLLPDRACFNAALTACARSGRPSEARQLVERMGNYALRPTPSCYTAIARAALQSGDRHGALVAIEELRRAGLQADWRALQVELTACEGLLQGLAAAESSELSERIAALVRESLRLHQDTPLRESDITWLWRIYSRCTLRAVRSCVASDAALPPADEDATSQLLSALSASASSGSMPSFGDERALTGYTTFHMINRAGKIADILRGHSSDRSRSALGPALLAASSGAPVISLGGGPAYDFAALALVLDFAAMEAGETGGLGAGAARVHVLDYEPRWKGAAYAVSAAVLSVLSCPRDEIRALEGAARPTGHQMLFGRCDLTKPLASECNREVRGVLADSRLLVCSYVICENARRLRETGYAFFSEVMTEAAPGTALVLTETTHRQFPELIAAARRGAEAHGTVDCVVEASVSSNPGMGGSQCIIWKRPRREVEEAYGEEDAWEDDEDQEQAALLKLYEARERAHRTSGRIHVEQNRPSRAAF